MYSAPLLLQQTSHELCAVSHYLQPHEECLNSSAQSARVQLRGRRKAATRAVKAIIKILELMSMALPVCSEGRSLGVNDLFTCLLPLLHQYALGFTLATEHKIIFEGLFGVVAKT